MTNIDRTLSDEEKQSLYRDGYIIVRNAVPSALVDAALARIKAAKKGENLGGTPEMTDLVNASAITPILHEAMGYFDPPVTCQVGVKKVTASGDHFNQLGYRERDQPYFAAEPYVDGR
jgi:hypothetical protein